MAFSHGPYTFDSQTDSDVAEFDWTDQTGTTTALQNSNTAGRWCWEDESTTSSNVGPDNGAGGDPDGYAYTEMSSQAVGDYWYVTFGTALDASANAITFEFKWCGRGDGCDPDIKVQTSENGGTWTDRGDLMGGSVRTIPGTSGVTTWWSESVDLTDLISHSSTEIRIELQMNGATSWHHDIGIDEIEITGTDLSAVPAITNADDEDFYIGETGVTITGTDFQTEGASSRVRIDSSSAGTGTSQTQVDTSWSDTSIDFTVSQGSLSYGTNYLFVRNHTDTEENATGYSINLYQNLTTSGLNDTTIYDEQIGIELSGTGFNSTQGTSKVYLCDSSDGSGTNVEQTVTTWTTTKVTFTVDSGSLSNGTVYVILGRNQSSLGDSGERLSPAQTATLQDAPSEPIITGTSRSNTLTPGETGATVSGSKFEAIQGSGEVTLCASSTYGSPVSQVETSWSDTEIEFTVSGGALSYGTVYIFVENDSAERNATGFAVTLSEPASDEGLFIEASFQTTITSTGLNTTAFMIRDE